MTIEDQITELFNRGMTHSEIGLEIGKPRRTVMKICASLGLKRTASEAASLKIKSDLDKPEIIKKITELRPTHSLLEIVAVVGGSVSSVERICQKYNISQTDAEYRQLQSFKMSDIWSDDKKKEAKIKSLSLVNHDLRDRLSASSKKLWQDPEYRKRQAGNKR